MSKITKVNYNMPHQLTVAEITDLPILPISDRKLSLNTCKKLGIRTALSQEDGKTPIAHYFPYYNIHTGKLQWYKKRDLTLPKNHKYHFSVVGEGKAENSMLFGQQGCSGGGFKLLVTEGEYDVASLFESMWENQKTPGEYHPQVVGLPLGCSNAVKSVSTNQKFVDSFKEKIAVLDNDDAGREALAGVSSLVPGLKTVNFPAGVKDPSDMLQAGESKQLFNLCIWNSKEYVPSGFITVDDVFEAATRMPTWGRPWPWPSLTKLTYGRRDGEGIYIGAGVKIGKCFGLGTKVRMWSGAIKNVEDIVKGDMVLSPDGSGKEVLSVHSGWDNMYEVVQNKRDNYIVNSEHLLHLQQTATNKKINVTVNDHPSLPKTKDWKGIASGAIEYSKKDLPIPPYILGLWLGDGTSAAPTITNIDPEIIQSWSEYGKNLGGKISTYFNSTGIGSYRIIFDGPYNDFITALRNLNVFKNKHIPEKYSISNVNDRLELLAGIIDTDGFAGPHSYEVTLKQYNLANSVCTIARSLGCRATLNEKIVEGVTYWRVVFGGVEIPVKLERKKLQFKNERNPLLTGITIKPIGYDEYYGFSIEGEDKLFLLEDYTIVHNSEAVNQIAHHITQVERGKVALFKLEEEPSMTVRRLAGKIKHKQFHKPDGDFTHEELIQGVEAVKASGTVFYDSYGSTNWSELKASIAHAVVVQGCKDIIIDPLTRLTQGTASEKNDQLEVIADEISVMAKDLGFFYMIFAHLKAPQTGKPHEEGGHVHSNQFTGSRAMMRTTYYFLGIERNKMEEDEDLRNTSTFVLLEDRMFGNSGRFDVHYNRETGDYLEPVYDLEY